MYPLTSRSRPIVALIVTIATLVGIGLLTLLAVAGGTLAINGTPGSLTLPGRAFTDTLLILLAYTMVVVATLFAVHQVRKEMATARDAANRAEDARRSAQSHLAAQTHELQEVRQHLRKMEEEHERALSTQSALLEREQQARKEAEGALRLRDDFLATVSHELRTPLNAIIGWLHVLEIGGLRGEDTQRAIEAIARNAKLQTRVVDDLLDVSRMIQGRFNLTLGRHDVRNIVSAAVDNFRPAAAAKHVGIELKAEGAGVHVSGDEARLQQAVRNLLSNAIKFTPRDGRIEVNVARAQDQARVQVADTGEGIDTAFLPHVFEPFRQGVSRSMRSGLGLGLTIVRELIELHGGTVVAESAGPGQGATFTVTLPLHFESETEDPGSGVLRLPGVRVLIAEDDEEIAGSLRAILGDTGCAVHIVRRGSDFVAELLDWQPQVVVCDVSMRDEDAYSLLRRVRKIEGVANVPAIALMTGSREDERTRALEAGYNVQLTKPPDAGELVREVAVAAARERVPVASAVLSGPSTRLQTRDWR